MRISTFSAVISFTLDTANPQLLHNPVRRMSYRVNSTRLQGRAIDNYNVQSIEVLLRMQYDAAVTTYTIVRGSCRIERRREFSFVLPEGCRKKNFEYRIQVSDGQNRASFPADDSWQAVAPGLYAMKKITPGGGVVTLDDGNKEDGETSIEIPPGALEQPVEVVLEELDPEDAALPDGTRPALSKRPVAAYRVAPEGLLVQNQMKIHLLYQDRNRNGTVDDTEYDTRTLGVLWWDGFAWRVLKSETDTYKNTVSARTSRFACYTLFPVGGFGDEDYRPKERIITPASIDRCNDCATFDAAGKDDTVTIFDVSGKRVRRLNGMNVWDGRDDNGDIVESGIYVYQIKTAGRIISGTIAVAK